MLKGLKKVEERWLKIKKTTTIKTFKSSRLTKVMAVKTEYAFYDFEFPEK